MTVCFWPRLCKKVFERDRYSKPDLKSRFYAKSTSADVPINFRFNVDARTSILAKRFYTLWANSGRSVSIGRRAMLYPWVSSRSGFAFVEPATRKEPRGGCWSMAAFGKGLLSTQVV